LIESGVTITAPRVVQPTSLAVVSLGAEGVPSYAFHRNGTAERQVTRDQLDSWLPSATSILHVGGLALIDGPDAAAWEGCFADCRARGVLTAMDPNVRPVLITDRDPYVARLKRMMQQVDIFKLSDEDLLWLYPDRPLEQALADCRADCGAALFVLTMGPDGAHGFAGACAMRVPSAPVAQMVDTVGAGDTFMASILAWVIETGRTGRAALEDINSDDLGTVLQRAALAAAINCGRQGCNPPTRAELGLQD
jgi:fructokinase